EIFDFSNVKYNCHGYGNFGEINTRLEGLGIQEYHSYTNFDDKDKKEIDISKKNTELKKSKITRNIDESKLEPGSKLAKEREVCDLMIKIYCNDHHHTKKGEMCSDCQDLSEYMRWRLTLCPFGNYKSFCSNCPIHCYQKDYRKNIREVMRYSGPKITFVHPYLAIKHVIQTMIEKSKVKKGKFTKKQIEIMKKVKEENKARKAAQANMKKKALEENNITPNQVFMSEKKLSSESNKSSKSDTSSSEKKAEKVGIKSVQVLDVIFGTETGSSEAVADMISEDAQKAGISKVVIHAADSVSLDDLKKMNYVVLVTSTSGEGEFPPNALEFGKKIAKAKKETTSLSNMKFAVLGLGDSSYSKFCEAARIVNEKFEQLGGHRFHPYTTIDEQSKKDPEEVVNAWIQDILKKLK
ncbi:hypothetical protein PIROE2DRAFT_5211, partial [Piromyces sp. E2]